ncbi:MAG: PASTA domain-containing protein [Ruminococcus sp.]|nr:PASTA domain-containing protein [Ruminococcus sp.]
MVQQSLDPDTEAKEGNEITLTISKGRDPNKAIEEKDVTLPNLIGMKYDDALKEAQKLGVSIKITEKRYSMSFEKDTVMKQSPEPGSTVKNTVTVEIIISLGYSKITVPDVSLISEEKAVALLEGRGLRCKVKYEKNNHIAAGHVISRDPFKETEVDPETLVTITVSMGAESFEMPDVVGLTREEAKALLESKGLSVSVNYEQNDDSPEGTVLTQSIKKGSGVIRGDTVILTICSHSETITVPYLVGMTQSEAEKEIRNAGLKVNVITVHGSDGDKGKVAAQSPTAGSGLRKGDTVSISVSDGGSDDTDSTADVGNDSSGKTDSSGSSESGGDSGSNNGSGEKHDDPNPITVELNTNELTLDIDETSVLSYETDTSKWIVTSEEWTSSKNNIVTVDGKGKVTAVDSGTAKIILTLKGKNSSGEKVTITAECEVTVKPPVQASEIILSETSLEMMIGDTAKLKATVKPDNAKNKRVSWSSSISSVVTVEDGYVKAVGVGTASVIATTSNGKTASCKITVKAPVPTGVTLSQTSVTLNEGESETITATVVPSNVIAKSVTWTSGNRSVATVSDGKITAVEEGTTTITATTSNGLKATCTVTVNEILPTSVSLDQTELTLYENEMTALTETVLPTKAKSKSVTWKSSDTSVVTVSDGKVTPVKAGNATITAETVNGLKASCAVTVMPLYPTAIKLNITSKEIYQGEHFQLEATLGGDNAKNNKVKWTSSDQKVAYVFSDGRVEGLEPGKATITAETQHGEKAVCKVTVKKVSVSLSPSNATMHVGDTLTVEAKFTPSTFSASTYLAHTRYGSR